MALIPFSSSVDVNCPNKETYSACGFEKVPPAAASTVDTVPLNVGFQFNGVSINQSTVMTGNIFIADTARQDGKVQAAELRNPASSANPYLLHKVNVLYWSHKAKNLLQAAGATALAQQPLNVLVDAGATGYSFERKAIYLGKRSDNKSLAFDGGVFMHLLGEHYAATASAGRIYNMAEDAGKHVDCRYENRTLFDRECCSSKLGCSKAVTAGLADYLVSQVFVDASQVGEYASQDPKGAQMCGLYRNPESNKTLTADIAYSACASVGQAGQVYAMGILFSSIWFEVGLQSSAPKIQLHRLYFQLLEKLEPQDTFVIVLAKIQTLDPTLVFYPLFRQEYIRRGLL